jgi:hypothetical protein
VWERAHFLLHRPHSDIGGGFSGVPFISLRNFSSIPSLVRDFFPSGLLILSNDFPEKPSGFSLLCYFVMWKVTLMKFSFFFLLLFMCAYKAWVISPHCPHPLPYYPLRPLPLPPTPSIPGRNYFALMKFSMLNECCSPRMRASWSNVLFSYIDRTDFLTFLKEFSISVHEGY